MIHEVPDSSIMKTLQVVIHYAVTLQSYLILTVLFSSCLPLIVETEVSSALKQLISFAGSDHGNQEGAVSLKPL